jgi:hypothetical protein
MASAPTPPRRRHPRGVLTHRRAHAGLAGQTRARQRFQRRPRPRCQVPGPAHPRRYRPNALAAGGACVARPVRARRQETASAQLASASAPGRGRSVSPEAEGPRAGGRSMFTSMRAMDQGRQGRAQVDAAVVPDVRGQRGAAPASCACLQSRQFPAHVGDARADQGLVADELEAEADQDRRKGGVPRTLCRLPDGRGRHPTANVPGDFAADRGTTAAAATSAGVRRPMVMRSRAPDRRRASKCRGKWPNWPRDHRSGCPRCRSPSAPRVGLAGRPEKREYSCQIVIRGIPVDVGSYRGDRQPPQIYVWAAGTRSVRSGHQSPRGGHHATYGFASVSTTNLDEIGGVRAARCPIAAKSLRTIASIDRKDATVGERHGVLTTGIIARNVRHHRQ